MKGPAPQNEFAKKAKTMKIPSQYDNKDYGKKTKIVPRNVHLIDTNTGACYGTRTIMTKESILPTFKQYLLEVTDGDITTLPDKVVSELKNLIRKGAQDLAQAWKNALELTNTAYHVSNVRLPHPTQKGAWKQYMDLIAHAVRQLSATRGVNGKWRVADTLVKEAAMAVQDKQAVMDMPIGNRRYFVELPGQAAVEVAGKSMDDIIDQIISRVRTGKEVRGTKVRVEYRDKYGAVLGIYVDNIKRDTVKIKEIS